MRICIRNFAPYLFLFFTFLYGCESGPEYADYLKIEATPVDLILNLKSYSSPAQVKAFLGLSDGDITVHDDNRALDRPNAPPFHVYTIKININRGIYDGELWLSFFNNRLMNVSFYPIRYDAFLKESGLNLKDTKENDIDGSIEIRPYTRIWLWTNYQGRRYIGYEDIRLSRQVHYWIRRYS